MRLICLDVTNSTTSGTGEYLYTRECSLEYFTFNEDNLLQSQAVYWYGQWTKNRTEDPARNGTAEVSQFAKEMWGGPNFNCARASGGCSPKPECSEIMIYHNGNIDITRKILFVTFMMDEIFLHYATMPVSRYRPSTPHKLMSQKTVYNSVQVNLGDNMPKLMQHFTQHATAASMQACRMYKFTRK